MVSENNQRRIPTSLEKIVALKIFEFQQLDDPENEKIDEDHERVFIYENNFGKSISGKVGLLIEICPDRQSRKVLFLSDGALAHQSYSSLSSPTYEEKINWLRDAQSREWYKEALWQGLTTSINSNNSRMEGNNE